MSEIYFCDVCNESVPVADLDQGRALRVKERVVCAACNRAMGGPSSANAPHPPVPLGFPAAGTIHSHGHTHTATHHAPSGSGAALTFGVLGLAVAISVGVWAHGEFDAAEARAAAAAERSAVALRDGQARLAAFELEASARRDAEASERREQVLELRSDLAELRSRAEARLAELASAVAGTSERLIAADEALKKVEQHEAELLSLQQKLIETRGALDALSAELAARIAAAKQGGGAAPSAAPEDPAWLALLEQLRSANVSERYVALVGLAASRDPRATAEVLPSLKDADIFLRMAAARALGDLASQEAIPALIDALDDEEALVREAAYLSLRSITQRDLQFDAHSPDAAERAKRIKAWREWWDKERPKAG